MVIDMKNEDKDTFSFERKRGIIWVCDVENSSKLINDDDTVDSIEAFLPRLYWISKQVVESANGLFIKWTGDGFLAWFECTLHRERGKIAAMVFNACWHLTYLINITQLKVKTKKNIGIRHGVTYEQDALFMKITQNNENVKLDLLGRAVVLAFRLSGIEVNFPRIVTQGDLAKLSKKKTSFEHSFEKINFTEEQILKYFKGDKISTRNIWGSSQTRKKTYSKQSIKNQIKNTISKVEENGINDESYVNFITTMLNRLSEGPEWAKDVLNDLINFTRTELYEPLKEFLSYTNKLEEMKK